MSADQFAVKGAARKIADALRAERIVFINGRTLDAIERAANNAESGEVSNLILNLRERDSDVLRIIEMAIEEVM